MESISTNFKSLTFEYFGNILHICVDFTDQFENLTIYNVMA